jgi:hypothetical protein
MLISFKLSVAAVVLITAGIALATETNVSTVRDFAGGLTLSAAFDPPGFFDVARSCLEQFPITKYQSQADRRQKDCLADWMKRHGATPPAITFMRLAPVPATISAIRGYGPVDVVYAAMLWADASDGWALVGKSGELVPLWNPPDLESDSQYREFKSSHPDMAFWTDSLTWPRMQKLPSGGIELLFGFSLKNCRACDKRGTAEVAYQFDQAGRFAGSRIDWIVVRDPSP